MWSLFARFSLVVLVFCLDFELEILSFPQSSEGWSAAVKSHEEAAVLTMDSWQRASAAVCRWSNGSSSSTSGLSCSSSKGFRTELGPKGRRQRLRGSSSFFNSSPSELSGLLPDWFRFERLSGTKSSLLSPLASSSLESGYVSEMGTGELLLFSASLKCEKED